MDDKFFDELVSIRRYLHIHPELGFREFATAELVESTLGRLSIPTGRVAETGVVGTLKKGEGPVVVLRADMDALPVREESGETFSSKTDGVMHACGHDLHTTMLLGAAHLLKETDYSGTIKFLFQPAEEGPMRSPEPGKSGGQLIAESGILKGADAIIGLHVHPLMPVGTLSYRNGEALSNVSNFIIRVTGKGGHPGWMKEVVDPIFIAAQIIAASRTLVGPQPDPPDAVFAVSYLSTGANPSFNIIPSQILLQGSLRAKRSGDYEGIVARLRKLLENLEIEFGCRIELEFTAYYPSLVNDPRLHERLAPGIKQVFGDQLVAGLTDLVAEDFAFYSRQITGQFYFLGAQLEASERYFLHHPKVRFNEECIRYGVDFLVTSALRLLSSPR